MKHKKTLFGVLVGAVLGLFAISVIPELKAITRNANATDYYTLITDKGDLSNGDKIVIKSQESTPKGVTGKQSTDKAAYGTNSANWMQYVVGNKSSDGWTLYDGTAAKYITTPTSSTFNYGDEGGTCYVDTNGVLMCNSRYLCLNGTNLRFYGSIGTYTPFYVYRVDSIRPATSISVKTAPTKTEYIVGEEFDPTGLVVTANYSEAPLSADVAYSNENKDDFTFTPAVLNATGNVDITIGYAGKTTTQQVTVSDPAITSIAVTTMPTKTSYYEGDTLDTTGIIVTGTYAGGTANVTSGCTFSPTTLNTLGSQEITVTHTASGQTTTFNVTVTAAPAIAEYSLLTNAADLTVGSKVLIAERGSSSAVMGAFGSSNFTAVTTATKNGEGTKILGLPANSLEFTIVEGTSTGTVGFLNGTKYISATDSKNTSAFKATLDTYSSFNVSIDSEGSATITCVASTSYNQLQKNTSSNLFSTYNGGQTNPGIYKYTSGAENITLNYTSLNFSSTSKQTLTATPTEGYTPTSYTWESSDDSVVELLNVVGDSATASAVGEGTATITCTAHGTPTRQATCEITVHDYDHSAIAAGAYYLLDRTFVNGLSASDVTKNVENIDLTDPDNLFTIFECNEADNAYYIMQGDEFLERVGSQARLELKDEPTTYWTIATTSTPKIYNIQDTNGNKLQFASGNSGIKWIAAPSAYYAEYLQIGLVGAQVFDHLSYTGTPTKTTYNVDEAFSSEGITVKAHYTDIEKDVTDKITWDAFKVGDTKATGRITVNDVERTIEVTGIQVTDYKVDTLSVDASSALTKYFVGQSLDKTGLVITATYKDAAGIGADRVNEPVALDNPGLTFSPETMQADTTEVTVSLGGKSAHYSVAVVAKQYFRATNLAKGDRVIFVDEAYAVEMAKTETKDFGKVDYSYYPDPVGDKATVFEVVDGVQKGMKAFKNVETNKYIAISGTKALEYTDTVTLESSWTTDVSKYDTIDYHIICNAKSTDKYMKYNPDGEGKFAVGDAPSSGFCVYRENVTAESIELSGDYKTSFKKGDTFEFGGTVTATLSNSKTVDVTSDCTFTGYDMNVAGQYTVTVSYYFGKAVSTTYVITVEDGGSGGGDTSSTTSSDTSSGSGSSTTSSDTSTSSGTTSTTSSTSEDQGGGNSPVNRLIAAIGVVGAVAVIGGSVIIGPVIIGGIVVGIIFIAKAAKKKK